MIEVIIIVAIVSVGIATVIYGLNSANRYLQKSREKIIAINLAREGMEAMINIRDSNRRKNAGKKEESWLKVNPINNTTTWFSTGIYILLKQSTGGQESFFAS